MRLSCSRCSNGDERTALEYFSRLQRASPESLIANYYLAQLRLRARDFDAAIALLEELVTPEELGPYRRKMASPAWIFGYPAPEENF
jgi:predicted Zn-dependent protease